MAGGESKDHRAALQIKALSDPSQADQRKKHKRRCESSYFKKPAAGGHADRRFHENCRRGGHSDSAPRFAQDRPRAQKTDALYDVGGYARASSVAKHACDFAGQNREKRGG